MTQEKFVIKWRTRYAQLRSPQPLSIFLRFYWNEIYADMEPFLKDAAKQYNEELLTNLVDIKELRQECKKNMNKQ